VNVPAPNAPLHMPALLYALKIVVFRVVNVHNVLARLEMHISKIIETKRAHASRHRSPFPQNCIEGEP
jgi:hypothetical protein